MRPRLLFTFLFVAAASALVPQAHANRDVVQFGSNIHVAPNSSVHDAVCFFCSVDNRGTIEGDTVVFFGNVHIDGHSNHDVVNFFGNVTVGDNSSVGHDLVNFFGSIRLGEDASVGKDLVAMFGGLHAAPSAMVGGDRVVQPGWIFWGPLLVFAVIIILVVREFRNHRRRAYLRGYPYPPQR